MKRRRAEFRRAFAPALALAIVAWCGVNSSLAQGNGRERTFSQSKATVEKALKDMQAASAGRLPVLEGFATSADHPLERYQRGYYQSKFQVSTAASGGSIVRVSVQVTAWYSDPVAAKSGYEVLSSNGRLEADLLDQLADQLGGKAGAGASAPVLAARRAFPSEKSGRGRLLRASLLQVNLLQANRLQANPRSRKIRTNLLFRRRFPGFRKREAVSRLPLPKVWRSKKGPALKRSRKNLATKTRLDCRPKRRVWKRF